MSTGNGLREDTKREIWLSDTDRKEVRTIIDPMHGEVSEIVTTYRLFSWGEEQIEEDLEDVLVKLRGDKTLKKRWQPKPPSIVERVDLVVRGLWSTTSAPTGTQRDGYAHAAEAFAVELERLRELMEERLERLEATLEAAGAPWTPGRVPSWEPE